MFQTYNNYRVQGCALGKIFREHFGLPSILAGMPRPKRWSPKYNLRGTLRAPKHFSWGARASKLVAQISSKGHSGHRGNRGLKGTQGT